MREQLRSERHKLFRRCVKVGSSQDLLIVQLAIADAIRKTERLVLDQQDKQDSHAMRFHIERLRLYADGLVWLVLHPHVIRQLAKNANVPKSLLGQGEAFDLVLRSAQHHFRQRHVPVLIADITNVIKVGDLIVVTNTEKPMIVESKKHLPKPEHLMQGRTGRQVSRAMGTIKYLHEGSAKVYGEEHYRHVLESQHKAERNWDTVDRVCATASREGWASVLLSEKEAMWAYTKQREHTLMSEIQKWHKEGSKLSFGTSLDIMNMRDGLFPPPSVWPISAELRFALLEEDVVLAHLMDLAAFECVLDAGESIKIDLSGGFPVRVTTGGQEYPLSLRFIYDVLYGFETIESCISGLFGFARQLHESLPGAIIEAGQTKPSVHYVGNMEEAEKLVRMGHEIDDDFSAMPLDLHGQLKKRRRATNKGTKMTFSSPAGWGGWVIMAIRDLRKMFDEPLYD